MEDGLGTSKWCSRHSLTLAGEIVFFFFKVADAMLEPSVRLFVYNKVCEMVTYPNVTSCYHRDEISTDDVIQQMASEYLTVYKVLLNTPAILLGCFCGAWSDRVGRKLPILVSCTGTIFAILVILCGMVAEDPRTTLLLTLVGGGIRGAFGRSAVVTMALHSYVTDLTTNETRTRVLGRLLGMNYFGYFLGSILGGGLLDILDFYVVFCVAIFVMGTGVFTCAIFMLDNTHHYIASESSTPVDLASDAGGIGTEMGGRASAKSVAAAGQLIKPSSVPFHPKHVRQSFAVIFRPRGDHLRHIIIILFITLIVQQTCKSGETDVTMLYVEGKPFNWSDGMYGYFLAADYALLGIITTLVLPLILRCCQPPDINLILIGIAFKVVRLGVMLFSVSTWNMFVAIILGCPSALIIAGAKSMLSKAIGDDEIGKTFSLLSCGETVANLLGSVTLTTIYGATAADFKGTVFIVDISINVILFIVVLYACWDLKIVARYFLPNTVRRFHGNQDNDNDAAENNHNYGTMDRDSERKPSPSSSEYCSSDYDLTK